jgi:hypothetical protein
VAVAVDQQGRNRRRDDSSRASSRQQQTDQAELVPVADFSVDWQLPDPLPD